MKHPADAPEVPGRFRRGQRRLVLGTSLFALVASGTAIGIPVAGAVGRSTASEKVAAERVGSRTPVSRTTRNRVPDTGRLSHRRPAPRGRWTSAPTVTRTGTTRVTPTRATATWPTRATPATSATSATSATGTTTGTTTATSSPPATSSLPPLGGTTENWAGSSPADYVLVPRGGSTVKSGLADSQASDGRVAELTIPAGAGATPANAAEVETKQQVRYGSFSSRVRTADCASQPKTGAVTGIFTYGNDGKDNDGDGITDNNELDFEVLCARPDEVHLSIWTDYRDSDEAQRRVTRVVNLRTGKILSTCYATAFGACQAVGTEERSPSAVPAVPGFDSSKKYHDYRIDWSADRVVFTMTVDGKDITLWDYHGPSDRIPQGTSAYMVNLWHTDNWSPDGMTAQSKPTAPLTAAIDSSTVRPGA